MDNEEVFLNQEFYKATYIDDEGFYVVVKYRKVERWAFYMRFISQWYIPCMKCQRKLKHLILNASIGISRQTAQIVFNQNVNRKRDKITYSFGLPFINALPYYEFKPCEECQKTIAESVINATTLTIGNKDYEQPVELQRKNEDDDESFETVEKHKATPEETKRDTGWNKQRITKEEYDKLPIIEE